MILLHQFQKAESPLLMKKEIFIQGKERADFEFFFNLAHHCKEFIAGFVKIDKIALATIQRGCGTEITTHRTSDGGNENGRRSATPVFQVDAHHPGSKSRQDSRMPDGRVFILAEVPSKPPDAVTLDDVICVDDFLDVILVRNVSTHNNHGTRLVLPDQLAHFFYLSHIGNDCTDSYNVVVISPDFFGETVKGGKIQ